MCDQFSLSTISHQCIVMSFYQHKNLHTKNDITMHGWEMVLSEHWSHASTCISLTCYSMAAAHHYSIHIDYLILKKVTFEFWTDLGQNIFILAMRSIIVLSNAERKLPA